MSSTAKETLNQSNFQSQLLSWQLRYRLNFHKEFMTQDKANNSSIALEALKSILEPKQTQEGIQKAVRDLQSNLRKEPKNVPGLCLLAMCYEEGLGVEKNPRQAFNLHSEAAKAEYAPSLNRLGVIHENHPNRNRNTLNDEHLNSAFTHYKAAVKQNYIPAIQNLARLYTDPATNFDQKLREEGLQLLKTAAESGWAFAQAYLAQQYDSGIIFEKDQTLAVYYFNLAAEQGDARAQCRMGDFYMDGESVEKDLKLAVEWYTRAADAGDGMAQERLVDCYQNGNGVEKNPERAQHYRQLAANNPTNLLNYAKSGGLLYTSGKLPPEAVEALLPHAVIPQPSWTSQVLERMERENAGPDLNSYEAYIRNGGRPKYRDDRVFRRFQAENQPDGMVTTLFYNLYKAGRGTLSTIGSAVGSSVGYVVNPCIKKCKERQKKQ